METKTEHTEQTSIVTLSGRLDAHTVPQVRGVVTDLMDQGHHRILVDMSGVNFVDSTGLSVLVSGMKRCRQAGGDLVLAHLARPLRLIFELTRLDKAFEIFPDRATALAEIGS